MPIRCAAGAEFPDGGYITRARQTPGGDYGEEAHWRRFHNAYADRIKARTDCGDLTRADGPCAPQIAHLFGVVAHGMGDQVWDWLFEPQGPDRNESFIPPELAGLIGPGGLETQMDVVAIVDHGRSTGPTPAEPSLPDLVAAFAAAGKPGITEAALREGKAGLDFLRTLEGTNAPRYHDDLVKAMPWTSGHVRSAAGGVDFGARAIAAAYETMWGRLLGRQPVTRVAVTAPFDGQDDVPATGWVREYKPGSHADGGGASTRITAVLSYSMPYVALASDATRHTPPEPPAGSMRLTVRDTGAAVPLAAGYPRLVPYDPDYGEDLLDIQPAADLAPCTWYRVDVTDRLIDADGRAVQPASWSFRTSCAAPAPLPAQPVRVTPTFTG